MVALVSCSSRQAKKQEHEGLFPIAENRRLGFIDATGKIVEHLLQVGLALVQEMDVEGYIDKTGKYVWQRQR